jgi:hypothetical protein
MLDGLAADKKLMQILIGLLPDWSKDKTFALISVK